MSNNQPTQIADRTAEFNNLRMQTLLETVTAQRNDAQNAVANLTADKAVLSKALQDAAQVSRAQEVALNDLNQQVTDLRQALSEAQESLRLLKPESAE